MDLPQPAAVRSVERDGGVYCHIKGDHRWLDERRLLARCANVNGKHVRDYETAYFTFTVADHAIRSGTDHFATVR